MADKKSIDKEYLLRQLQLLAGHELYGETTDMEVVSAATAERYAGTFTKTTYTHFKYTGTYEATQITTAAEQTTYTAACGETIVIGDKVRPCVKITDDNLGDYSTLVPGVAVGDYVYPADDCRMAGMATDVQLTYLNTYFFKDKPVVSGEYITYIPDVINETTNPLGNYIQDLYKKKLTITYCTTTQYNDWQNDSKLQKNIVYYITNADEPTAWLNEQNILGGGSGIDTSTANDGDFLVYSATAKKPVWKEIIDAMAIGW